MKIYTKTGDAGKTSLFSGRRVEKFHPRVAAYGSLDELNSQLGLALALQPASEVAEILAGIQNRLFDLGAELATEPGPKFQHRIGPAQIAELEASIDRIEAALPVKDAFVLPGGTPAAAVLHVARTICRRAEREAVHAATTEQIPADALIYLNRLSDALFQLARRENQLKGHAEIDWKPSANPQ